MLTPSCLARAVSRACKLRGMRAINFPLGKSPGRGISRPASSAALIHAETASRPLAMASSGVSPSDMQPGKSGKTISQPPPSFRGRLQLQLYPGTCASHKSSGVILVHFNIFSTAISCWPAQNEVNLGHKQSSLSNALLMPVARSSSRRSTPCG